jgi:chromosome segregation ATPase
MLSAGLRNSILGAALAFCIGVYAGYSFSDAKAEAKQYKANIEALEIERAELFKQLEKEHEYQQTAKAASQKAEEDLADLEDRYADAINALNDLQLQQLSYDNQDAEPLSESSSSTADNSKSSNKCSQQDRAKLQRLYEEQLTLARDCDINAIHLNQLIDLYNSIQ